jgi:hypothetical protein
MNGHRWAAQELAHLVGMMPRPQRFDADSATVANAAMQKNDAVSASCCWRERI